MCNLPLPMPNIKKLRDNLNSLGFHITAFDFTYKNVTYSVLFEVSDNIKEVSKYYIALLTFYKQYPFPKNSFPSHNKFYPFINTSIFPFTFVPSIRNPIFSYSDISSAIFSEIRSPGTISGIPGG